MNRIDSLESKQASYERDLEKFTSKINFKNAGIEAKIKKLEEKAFLNRTELDKFKEITDRKLELNTKMILAEAEYAQSLSNKYKKRGK